MFELKDSGMRQEFSGGMVRDTQEGKVDWWRVSVDDGMPTWGDYYESSVTQALEHHFCEHEDLQHANGLTIEVRRINK